MPIEEYGEEGLKKIPNLDLAQALFTLQNNHTSEQDKNDAKSLLEKEITESSKIFSFVYFFYRFIFTCFTLIFRTYFQNVKFLLYFLRMKQ